MLCLEYCNLLFLALESRSQLTINVFSLPQGALHISHLYKIASWIPFTVERRRRGGRLWRMDLVLSFALGCSIGPEAALSQITVPRDLAHGANRCV